MFYSSLRLSLLLLLIYMDPTIIFLVKAWDDTLFFSPLTSYVVETGTKSCLFYLQNGSCVSSPRDVEWFGGKEPGFKFGLCSFVCPCSVVSDSETL